MSNPEATAVFGDGVITIPVSGPCEENCEMSGPIDLPPNVASSLQIDAVGGINARNQQIGAIGVMATGVLQAAMARNFDKLGTEEARALSGLNNTPLGAPSGNKAQA